MDLTQSEYSKSLKKGDVVLQCRSKRNLNANVGLLEDKKMSMNSETKSKNLQPCVHLIALAGNPRMRSAWTVWCQGNTLYNRQHRSCDWSVQWASGPRHEAGSSWSETRNLPMRKPLKCQEKSVNLLIAMDNTHDLCKRKISTSTSFSLSKVSIPILTIKVGQSTDDWPKERSSFDTLDPHGVCEQHTEDGDTLVIVRSSNRTRNIPRYHCNHGGRNQTCTSILNKIKSFNYLVRIRFQNLVTNLYPFPNFKHIPNFCFTAVVFFGFGIYCSYLQFLCQHEGNEGG